MDVLTPKQVLLFAPLAKELEARGAEVLATSRRYREVGPMAEMCGLELEYVGERGGEDLAGQLAAATERQLKVIPIVKRFGPGAAVSVASGVCARVAFGLRARHIAVNDSPHSEVAGRLSLPLSAGLLCPWVIPYSAWARFGVPRTMVTRYRALDPAAWLKRPAPNGPAPRLRAGRKTITVRLEESFAPYMAREDRSLSGRTLSMLAEAFPEANKVALCRYGEQLDAVRREFGGDYVVPEGVVDGRRLLGATDLFVGMGGTMTAEAALMGVPTISAFQGVLYTEVYLKAAGLIAKTQDPAGIVRAAGRMLDGRFRKAQASRARKELDSMEDPVPVIADALFKAASA